MKKKRKEKKQKQKIAKEEGNDIKRKTIIEAEEARTQHSEE